MRFQKIQVPSFGPFTDLQLTFPEKPGDLQIVYGANEAGKSSLLRAIRDLLFGIPGQSSDNFLHEYSALRIQGEISNRAGTRLSFQRRKGQRNTLLDAAGQPLPDTSLLPFLGGVDAAYFSSMFGLGARELHEGAEQLLRGDGDMGKALFSASLGGTPVQKVLEALQEGAGRLYKGRATANVSIRPAITRHRELLRQCREAMVSPEAWELVERQLTQAEAERQRLEIEIASRQREVAWLERCEDALPTVVRLAGEREKLALLPPLPELAGDFTSRARRAQEAVGQAQSEVQRLTAQVARLRTSLDACPTAPAVLAEAEALDPLHQDVGVYRERKRAAADLQMELAGLEPFLRVGMQNLELTGEFASLDERRLSTPVQLAGEAAARNLQKTSQEQVANADKAESLQRQIIDREAALGTLPETNLEGLREALAVAAAASEADRTLATSEAERRRLARETAAQHRLVTGAPDDFVATAQWTVPTLSTIRRFQELMENLKREISAGEKEVQESEKRRRAIEAELARLQRRGELPTEEALRLARARRDHGWSRVLADWKGGGAREEWVPGSPLEEAFPRSIAQADEIADQLRLEAEAVAQAEEKRSQLSELARAVDAAAGRMQKLRENLAEQNEFWSAEWSACGMTPRSPLEMEEWRHQWSEFRVKLGQLQSAEEGCRQKRDQIQQAQRRLSAVLGQPEDKEYSLLFAAARQRVQEGEQAAGRRLEMASQLKALQGEWARLGPGKTALAAAAGAALSQWHAQCALAGLPAGTAPEAGLTLLQERKALLVKYDQWREASGRRQRTIEAITRYEQRVNRIAGVLGVTGDTIEALEASLWKTLADARKSRERHDQWAGQIEQASLEYAEAQRRAVQAEQHLGELIHLAGLISVAELEPLLAHLERRTAVQRQIDELRQTLSGLARGQSVEDFVTRVSGENPDSLEERKTLAIQAKSGLESRLAEIREELFGLTNQKRTLEKTGDAAADFRQQAESCAAALKQDVFRYVRLRLAAHLLENQVERFRKENQGPLLQRSGGYFQAITRGAFRGLGADFSADDLPILVGIRPDAAETRVPVEGLSEGSRDQLYLALRLAALDRHLGGHEPMPLILDDLLITFDDERARAILPQLGQLARRTQIFLFTHHEHLIELCRQTLGEGQFHLHRLTRDTSKAT